MEINKTRYKILTQPQKIYCGAETSELRQRLNIAFAKTVSEDETTGILGKYLKHSGKYRIKYIYARNAQLQAKTFERYYLLAEVGADEKGAYTEYALVYDRLYEPAVRSLYVLTVLLLILCMLLLVKKKLLDRFSAYTLSAIAVSTVFIVFKKSRETEEEAAKAVKIFEKLLKNF